MPIQFADIYEPLKFNTMAQEAQIEKNAFIQSGVQTPNSDLISASSAPGWSGDTDNIQPLTCDEPDYTNDNPNDKAGAGKLGTQLLKYRKAARHKAWSAMNLAQGIALNDPMKGITARVGHYWAVDNQRRLIHSFVGLRNLVATSHSGDMIHDVSNDAAGAVSDAERASAVNFLKALELKGDMDNIAAIGMHSSVYYGLRQLKAIKDHDHTEDGGTAFSTFEGKTVIVDDGLPAETGTNRVKFTSILFGAGAIAAGEGNMPGTVASEYHRDPAAGNGGGQDTLHTRRTDILMPVGFSFIGDPASGTTATYAELATATNWQRVWDPKNIPVSFLITNG